MKKRFNIFAKNSRDGLVKFHCEALQTEEVRGNEVMLETDTYLPRQLGGTYYGLKQGAQRRELWEIEFQGYEEIKKPHVYHGTFVSKLREVDDEWVED